MNILRVRPQPCISHLLSPSLCQIISADDSLFVNKSQVSVLTLCCYEGCSRVGTSLWSVRQAAFRLPTSPGGSETGSWTARPAASSSMMWAGSRRGSMSASPRTGSLIFFYGNKHEGVHDKYSKLNPLPLSHTFMLHAFKDYLSNAEVYFFGFRFGSLDIS